jgi:hypothetical protein
MQYNVYRYTSALQGGFSSNNRQHSCAVIPRSGPPRLTEAGKKEGDHLGPNQKKEVGHLCVWLTGLVCKVFHRAYTTSLTGSLSGQENKVWVHVQSGGLPVERRLACPTHEP